MDEHRDHQYTDPKLIGFPSRFLSNLWPSAQYVKMLTDWTGDVMSSRRGNIRQSIQYSKLLSFLQPVCTCNSASLISNK